MKEGTGGDPFADDVTDDDAEPESASASETDPSTSEAEPSASGTGSDSGPTAETKSVGDSDTTAAKATAETGSTTGTDSTAETATRPDLPYIYRRGTVKEDRDQVPFFLRDHVRDLEDEFIDDLEARLDTNVYKADAREAALEIVYEKHVAEVADRLREWGYDRK